MRLSKRVQLESSLYTLLQILSVTLFEKIPLSQALLATVYKQEEHMQDNQLDFFNLLTRNE